MAVNNNILYSNASGNVGICLGNNNPVCRVSVGVGLGEYTGYGITYTGSPTEVKAGILVCADTGAVNMGALNSSGTWCTTIRSNNFPVATFNDNANTPNLFCRRDFDPSGVSPVTCYCKVAEFFGRDVNISSGKVDCGYRVGLVTETYFDEAVFAGTLRQSIGVWARVGTYGSNPTGTICCAMAVDVDTLKGSNSTIHNLYGIYQHGSDGTKNYFQHCVGIGTTAPTGQLSVCNSNAAVNTCLQIKNKCTDRYSYLQLENNDNSHQYHLGIGNTLVPNEAVRGKFYLFAYASNKSLLEIDSSGRTKFQTSVGSGGANASATWHTETSGLQLVGPCACTLSRFMITAVDPASSPNACAVYSNLTMGHWDNSRVLLESSGKQLMITSYDEGIALGNDGNAELCIGTLGDVIITPTTAKNVDPLGTLCLDITGSTNPQNGGIVMDSTSQTHIRFLSSGNLCWQWRHHSPASCDVFSVYSWKRACDMFMIKAPIDTDTGFTSFGPYGHIISCAPLLVGNTSNDPYFINTGGSKCIRFYTYCFGTTSCFPQTHFMVRYDSSLTNVCQVYPTATLYNANDTEGTSSTLAFAGREAGGGNSVGLAYISGRKESSVATSWANGSLNFLVNCDGCQCWTMCMTMCGGVCAIKCFVAPIIQLANSNCVLCLATGGSAGPYFQGSADCTTSYWGVNSSWKAQINSTGGFCAANCAVAPVFCANSTTVPLSLTHSGVAAYNWCFIDANSLSFHPNTTSTKTLYFCNAGTGVMNVCVEGCLKTPVVCGTTCLSSNFLLIGCNAAGLGCGVTACFSRINDTGPDGHRLAIVVDPAANVVLYCSTGTSLGGHCFFNCAFSPYIYATCLCGTSCIKGNITCGGSCVVSPIICGGTCLKGTITCGVTCVVSSIICGGSCVVSPIICGGSCIKSADCVIGLNVCMGAGWFRNGTSGTGLYNAANTLCFFSSSACEWTAKSNSTVSQMQFDGCIAGPLVVTTGYVYGEACTCKFGLLNCAHSWAVQVCPNRHVYIICTICSNITCGITCSISPIVCATTTMQVGGNDVLTTASSVGANFCAGTDVNNRVVTANGASGSLCGEANMTFDGSTLNVTGAITASGDITSTSDERVKREIAAICGAIQIVNNLCGRIFIKDNRQQVGVIAQEVEKVLPQVVFEHSNNDLKSVSYGNIVGVLIEAIKEQDKRIDKLEKIIQGIQ